MTEKQLTLPVTNALIYIITLFALSIFKIFLLSLDCSQILNGNDANIISDWISNFLKVKIAIAFGQLFSLDGFIV